MQPAQSAIAVVLLLGGVILTPLLLLPTLRRGVTATIQRRWFAWPVLSLFGLMFWPGSIETAYSTGVELGAYRIVRMAVMLGLFFALIFRFLRDPIWLKRSILNWYLLYVVTCTVSTIYAPSWQEALWKSFELIVILIFAAVTRADLRRGRLDLIDILSVYLLLLVITVLLALIGSITSPSEAYGQGPLAGTTALSSSLSGIIPRATPNSLGQFSAMVLFAGIAGWTFSDGLRKESLVFIAIGSVVLVLAHARTALVAAFVLILCVLLLSRRGKTKTLLLPIPLLVVLGGQAMIEYLMRGQSINLFRSLSGRTHMWETAWESITQNPWLGLGMSGHKSLDISVGMEFSTLDSAYIEALVNVGVVGTSFLVVFIIAVLSRAAKLFIRSVRESNPMFMPTAVAAGFIFIMFIRSLTGPSFQALHWNLVMLLTLAVAILEPGRRFELRRARD